MLVQNRIFTAEAQRTQRKHFLFGGEPFDRAHGPESIEGIPHEINRSRNQFWISWTAVICEESRNEQTSSKNQKTT
jgi:hypothetical protein